MSSHPLRDSLFNRLQSGFFFFLAAFALILAVTLLCPPDSLWLRERGRSALLLGPCAAFALGALLPRARSAWTRALWGGAIALSACACAILCRDIWPSQSPLYAKYARLALSTQWIALLASAVLGCFAALASARAQDARFVSRPKAIRAQWSPSDHASSMDRAMTFLEVAKHALGACDWELQELDEAGSARAYQPNSGLLLSVEPLQWASEPDGADASTSMDNSSEPARDEPESSGSPAPIADEWIISLVWNPGLNPLRQLRGPRLGEDPAAAQSSLLRSLLAHPSVIEASAIS